MRYTCFICIISNLLETTQENELLTLIKKLMGPSEKIFPVHDWIAPVEYEQEMGPNLNVKIIVLEKQLNIEEVKEFCMEYEKKTSQNNKRIFNLNPGFLNNEGMFLLSHKPNEKRSRQSFGKYWAEKQYDVRNGLYVENLNTFSEYKKTLNNFNEILKK